MARWLKQNESIGRGAIRMLVAMSMTLTEYQQQAMNRFSLEPPKKATPELTKEEISARRDRAEQKRERRRNRNVRIMQA